MKKCRIETIEICLKSLLNELKVDKKNQDEIWNYFRIVDAAGVNTHGLTILKALVEKIERKSFNIHNNSIYIEKNLPAFSVVDANNMIGYSSATQCMKLAIEKASDAGMYTVFCHNANTYGAAFYYTKLAMDNGMIGITSCNSPAAMAPWGGKDRLIGTNPLAVGIPGTTSEAVLFDMSSSIVAKSKINEARKKSSNIPKGWALDKNGNETTNPIEAINGLILPMAGPKGYGLAMCIDIISGMLSGASYMDGVNKFYSDDNSCMNVGQLFIAINPRIVASENFYNQVDDYIKKVKLSRALPKENIRIPGEQKILNLDESLEKGIICLEDYVIEAFNVLLKRYGIDRRI